LKALFVLVSAGFLADFAQGATAMRTEWVRAVVAKALIKP